MENADKKVLETVPVLLQAIRKLEEMLQEEAELQKKRTARLKQILWTLQEIQKTEVRSVPKEDFAKIEQMKKDSEKIALEIRKMKKIAGWED